MTNTFLNAEDKAEIKERFEAELTSPVRVALFTRAPGAPDGDFPACYSCEETEGLMRELAQLSDNFVLEVIDVDEQPDLAAQMEVTVTPTFFVGSEAVRFLGFPAGYEFVSFLETLLSAPLDGFGLDPTSIERVRTIEDPVQIKVFSTPT